MYEQVYVCARARAHTPMHAEACRVYLFHQSPPIALRQDLFLNLELIYYQLCWKPANISSPLSVSSEMG